MEKACENSNTENQTESNEVSEIDTQQERSQNTDDSHETQDNKTKQKDNVKKLSRDDLRNQLTHPTQKRKRESDDDEVTFTVKTVRGEFGTPVSKNIDATPTKTGTGRKR